VKRITVTVTELHKSLCQLLYQVRTRGDEVVVTHGHQHDPVVMMRAWRPDDELREEQEEVMRPGSEPVPRESLPEKTRQDPTRETYAQQRDRIVKELAAVEGLADFAALWKRRLDQTARAKRPNVPRQVAQLKKLQKGLGAGRSGADVRSLVELAAEGGWSGINWRYLDEHFRQDRWKAPRVAVEPEPLDIPKRCAALADAIPECLVGGLEIAAAVRALSGEAEAVESALQELDGQLLRYAWGALADSEREAIQSQATPGRTLLNRLSNRDLKQQVRRSTKQLLRAKLKLPLLSLFSATAEEADGR